jgi:hypothetical protein
LLLLLMTSTRVSPAPETNRRTRNTDKKPTQHVKSKKDASKRNW